MPCIGTHALHLTGLQLLQRLHAAANHAASVLLRVCTAWWDELTETFLQAAPQVARNVARVLKLCERQDVFPAEHLYQRQLCLPLLLLLEIECLLARACQEIELSIAICYIPYVGPANAFWRVSWNASIDAFEPTFNADSHSCKVVCCRDVPVYMGAQGQLLGDPMDPCDFHGSDGLGDAPDAEPAASSIQVNLEPGRLPYCRLCTLNILSSPAKLCKMPVNSTQQHIHHLVQSVSRVQGANGKQDWMAVLSADSKA